jgi:hypothetical protein
MLRQHPDDLRREISRLPRRSDQHGWPKGSDYVLERGRRRIGQADDGQVAGAQRNLAFVEFEILAALANHPAGIHKDLSLPHLGFSQTLRNQRGPQEPPDTDAGGTRASQQETLIPQATAGER